VDPRAVVSLAPVRGPRLLVPGVQVLGVTCYDVSGWNGRLAWDVVGPGSDRRVTYDDQRVAERKVREEGGRIEPRQQSVDLLPTAPACGR